MEKLDPVDRVVDWYLCLRMCEVVGETSSETKERLGSYNSTSTFGKRLRQKVDELHL